ncbi:MAG: hypothetical protein V7K42_28710 [Nostoc sp.]
MDVVLPILKYLARDTHPTVAIKDAFSQSLLLDWGFSVASA